MNTQGVVTIRMSVDDEIVTNKKGIPVPFKALKQQFQDIRIGPGATIAVSKCNVPYSSDPRNQSKTKIYVVEDSYKGITILPDANDASSEVSSSVPPGSYTADSFVQALEVALNFYANTGAATPPVNELGLDWQVSETSGTGEIKVSATRYEVVKPDGAYILAGNAEILPTTADPDALVISTGANPSWTRDFSKDPGDWVGLVDNKFFVRQNHLDSLINLGPSGDLSLCKNFAIGVINGDITGGPSNCMLIGIGVDDDGEYCYYLNKVESKLLDSGTPVAVADTDILNIDFYGDYVHWYVTDVTGTTTRCEYTSKIIGTSLYGAYAFPGAGGIGFNFGFTALGDVTLESTLYHNTNAIRTTDLGTGTQFIFGDSTTQNIILQQMYGFKTQPNVQVGNPAQWTSNGGLVPYGYNDDVSIRASFSGNVQPIGYSTSSKGNPDPIIGRSSISQLATGNAEFVTPWFVPLNNKGETNISRIEISFILSDGTALDITGAAEVWLLLYPGRI